MFVPLQQLCGFAVFRSGRRIIAGALTGLYLLVCAGVPLPIIRSSSHDQERFPCESCGCGCDSAEHCWRSCCCHTLAERLAWAAKNDVVPPDFAIAEARRAGLDATGRSLAAPIAVKGISAQYRCASHSCCKPAAAGSCCSSHTNSNTKANYKHHESKHRTNHLAGWRALACQGQTLGWLAAVPSLIVVDPDFSPQLLPTTWLGHLVSEKAFEVAFAPSLPPPERA
jgi:hypothetical protein